MQGDCWPRPTGVGRPTVGRGSSSGRESVGFGGREGIWAVWAIWAILIPLGCGYSASLSRKIIFFNLQTGSSPPWPSSHGEKNGGGLHCCTRGRGARAPPAPTLDPPLLLTRTDVTLYICLPPHNYSRKTQFMIYISKCTISFKVQYEKVYVTPQRMEDGSHHPQTYETRFLKPSPLQNRINNPIKWFYKVVFLSRHAM